MSQAFQFSKFQRNGRINGVKLSLDSTVRSLRGRRKTGRGGGEEEEREKGRERLL